MREPTSTLVKIIKANMVMGFILLIGWLLTSWLASWGLIDLALPNAYQSQLYGVTRIIGAALVAIFLVLMVGLVYFPARHYKKMGGFIKNPFEITPSPTKEDFDKTGSRWEHIIVRNKSDINKIGNCFLKLTGICKEGEEPREFIPQNLSWSAREGIRNEEKTVNCNDERVCDVATTVLGMAEDTAKLTVWFGEGYPSMMIDKGRYTLTVEAHGVWQDIPITRYYSVALNFESKSKLVVEGVSEIEVVKNNSPLTN